LTPAWPRTVKWPTTRQSGKTSTTVNRTRPPWRRRNTRIEKRRAFGPCRTRNGRELRRCVTVGGGALESPDDEAVNILAAADPGAAEPFPPDVPFCSDGIIPARADVAEFGAVVRLAAAVPGTTVVIFGVVVAFGSVVVTFGTAVVTFGSVVVTFGTAVVTFGSVVVTFGSVVVTFGSVVVTFGSVVVTFGSVVVTFGSVVVIGGSGVLTGSVVVIVGSADVIPRAGAADGPGTAVLAIKPRIRRTVKVAATLTAPQYPDRQLRNPRPYGRPTWKDPGNRAVDRRRASVSRETVKPTLRADSE
jgi:hypothetical protein